jgi:hypothetical protein
MITSVSTWRCKCGAYIKVVSETPKDKPLATHDAVCPKCGDIQLIYGYKLLSVSLEGDTKVEKSQI